jgi:hypothetical protein
LSVDRDARDRKVGDIAVIPRIRIRREGEASEC